MARVATCFLKFFLAGGVVCLIRRYSVFLFRCSSFLPLGRWMMEFEQVRETARHDAKEKSSSNAVACNRQTKFIIRLGTIIVSARLQRDRVSLYRVEHN